MAEKALEKVNCRLCGEIHCQLKFQTNGRDFFECPNCDLLFVNETDFLSPQAERERYDKHVNLGSDSGYVAFLTSLVDSVTPKLEVGRHGLDFGCGPSTVMQELFENRGYKVDRYDPYFAPDLPLGPGTYDFLVCCEVAEHFRSARQDFSLIETLLKPGGIMAVMTGIRDAKDADWWYLRDPTHVNFYSKRTFHFVAELLHMTVWFPVQNVILLQK